MKTLRLRRLLRASVILLLSACSSGQPAATLTPVTVQLRWTHQAQFAGFYAADQNGYYADEGLAVTFLEGGPTTDAIAPVVTGAAQFGVAGADSLILARASSQPVRGIATILRRSPLVFLSLADSGITRPQDFVGKTIRVTVDTAPAFHAMMARVGITPDQYTEVNLPNDIIGFASGQAAVWGAYVSSFAIAMQEAGYQLNLIFPDDYGVHFYADTLFTTNDLIANDPDLVLRFTRASLKGWSYAVENPQAIGSMVAKYDPNTDVALQINQMIASLPLVNTGEDHIGWMKPEIWAGMEQVLREQSVLTQSVDVTQAYSLQFLREIYP